MRGLILFDLDGTLMDSAPGLANSANFLRSRAGLAPLPYEALREHCGSGAAGMIWAGLRMPPTASVFEASRRDFLEHYAQIMVQDSTPFEGVPDMLARLTEMGLAWGIVTNKAIELARPLCEAKGIARHAACILSGQSFPAPKPAPDALLHAMATLAPWRRWVIRLLKPFTWETTRATHRPPPMRKCHSLPPPGATPAAAPPSPTGERQRWPGM